MNCPSCSEPMLFGSTECACGYRAATSQSAPGSMELTYWEALRAYWRVYWPAQILQVVAAILLNALYAAFVSWARSGPGLEGWAGLATIESAAESVLIFQFVLSALLLLALVSRLVARPYRGFSLLVALATGESSRTFQRRARIRVWFFLWWRQIAAGVVAVILLAPLNMMLATMGVRLSAQIGVIAGLLIVGPMLIKMLVGQPFPGFSIEVIRPPTVASAPPAA